VSKHNRKKIRKQAARLEELKKAEVRHIKKRDGKTERWAGGIKPAMYGKSARSFAPKGGVVFGVKLDL
jgi:hypothetical protein